MTLSRKEQRREERNQKKKRQKVKDDREEPLVVEKEAKKDVKKSKKEKKKKHQEFSERNRGKNNNKGVEDPYANLPSDVAAAMRRDDEEIAALEAKMGLSSSKDKSRLYREYAKLECYGDDFGTFLDDVDSMVMRVVRRDRHEDDDNFGGLLGGDDHSNSDNEGAMQLHYLNSSEDEEEDDDEIVPMKDASYDDDEEELEQQGFDENDNDNSSGDLAEEDSNVMEQKLEPEKEQKEEEEESIENPTREDDEDSNGTDHESGDEVEQKEPDHKAQDTYQPSTGEDIYGNSLGEDNTGPALKKYVPPHLRKQQQQTQVNEKEEKAKEEEEAKRKLIRRLLNNSLNRLSEDTLISVSQALAGLYQSYPTPTVNECIWTNLQNACVFRPNLMTGLTPVYVACVAGVHFQKGESAQLGEYILEMAITDLWKEMKVSAKKKEAVMESEGDDNVSKQASNLMLVVCYLYNYGIVHCSCLYSIIRRFIDSFQEVDVELLLLMLSHCGRALRSDDPLALKEIVMLVQKRALEVQDGDTTTSGAPLSSRVEYMVSAMMDLKNNKKRSKDTAYAERVAKIRKLLGQIKSASGAFKSTESSSLRIGLDDILNVAEKGRWWKVGASWVGNQYRFSEDGGESNGNNQEKLGKEVDPSNTDAAEEDATLLKLAAKARMNTDAKRAIFCIIMKSADCEDAFEKLSRAGHLKNRKERDTVRVLMECCGNEKSYNPFYAHLAVRMCEYQPQCKFSMQLAYWDFFKQFDDSVSMRKAANLAKLLFHMVVAHPAIRLGVLKVLDLSSPDELADSAMIFLTLFFTNLLEYFEDPNDLKRWLEGEVKKHRGGEYAGGSDDEDDIIGGGEEEENADDDGGLGPSISIFLLQTLKASPKYKKGSKFRANLKAAVKACDTEDFFM